MHAMLTDLSPATRHPTVNEGNIGPIFDFIIITTNQYECQIRNEKIKTTVTRGREDRVISEFHNK